MTFDCRGPGNGDEIPPEVYQLADHLDAALAAAEDLVEAGRQWVPANADEGYLRAVQMAGERQVIERVRTFETVLIGRVLKARKRARALAHKAGEFAGITRLFVGGTAPLTDAVEELGDSTWADFETCDSALAYLRQRGVIAEDAADLPEDRAVSLGDERFLVAGRIALAPLTEMIIAFLDALDAHYELYSDEPGGDEPMGWGFDGDGGEAVSHNTAQCWAALEALSVERAAVEASQLGPDAAMKDTTSDAALAAAVEATRISIEGGAATSARATDAGDTGRTSSAIGPATANSLIERLGAVAQSIE